MSESVFTYKPKQTWVCILPSLRPRIGLNRYKNILQEILLKHDSAWWINLSLLMSKRSRWDEDQLAAGIKDLFSHRLPMCVRDLMVTWIAQSTDPVLTGLTAQRDSQRSVLSLSFFLFCSNPSKTPHYSLHFDALWQILFTFSTSHSSAVTNHLMKSKDSNLLFTINKSLHCEKCLLFVTALKTITVNVHFSSACVAYFMAMLCWWWKWKSNFIFTNQSRPNFLGRTMVNSNEWMWLWLDRDLSYNPEIEKAISDMCLIWFGSVLISVNVTLIFWTH